MLVITVNAILLFIFALCGLFAWLYEADDFEQTFYFGDE